MTIPGEAPAAPADIDDIPSLLILLMRARALVAGRFRAAMRKHDLTEQQYRILTALNKEDFTDVKALAERTDLFASSVSRILRDLDARGLILRVPGRADARQTLAILTPQGRDLIARTMIDVRLARADIDGEIGIQRVLQLRYQLNELLTMLSPGTLDDD